MLMFTLYCVVIRLDGMTKEEMAAVMKKFDMKAPLTNNPLSEPIGKQLTVHRLDMT